MKREKINWFLINENYGANLCPFAFHFDADYHGFKKEYGKGVNYQAVGIENGFLRQVYDLEDYNAFARFFFNKLINEKEFARKVLKNIYGLIKEFYSFNKKFAKKDLTKLSNKQLAEFFEKFYNYFFQISTWSVPFAFTEYGTSLWTNASTEYLNSCQIPKKYTVSKAYQILTSNRKKTYTAQEKEDILKLAIEVKQSKILSKIFKKPTELIKKILENKNNKFLDKIKNHTKKYNWINFGFEGPLLDIEYFISSIKDYARNKNPKQELNQIKKWFETLSEKQNQLIKEIKIDAKHKWMFWIIKEFGFQKTFRKDVEYYAYYIYDMVLKEFGRRFHLTVKQGHYLLKDEIIAILLNKKRVNVDKINERIKSSFYVVIRGKAKLLTGKQARDFIKKIKSRPIPKNLKELSGQCACGGYSKGKAKIIKNKEDYKKFKTDDILVSYATNPNMVSLMKKSSAIITDEGGITCHAAIVSRELGIPCVIGTRFATKVLKDGQLVEVDANKGIVKIIKE